MIKNLSPSRASQFKTCPKQFKFANVDKLKEPTNEVQAKGTTVHQALEDLFDLPKEERSIEKLHNLEVLPSKGFTVSCFPVKIRGASAGWTRAVAIINS